MNGPDEVHLCVGVFGRVFEVGDRSFEGDGQFAVVPANSDVLCLGFCGVGCGGGLGKGRHGQQTEQKAKNTPDGRARPRPWGAGFGRIAVQTVVTGHCEMAPGDRGRNLFSSHSILTCAQKLQLPEVFSLAGSCGGAGSTGLQQERPGEFRKTDFPAEPSPCMRVTGCMPAYSSRISGAWPLQISLNCGMRAFFRSDGRLWLSRR